MLQRGVGITADHQWGPRLATSGYVFMAMDTPPPTKTSSVGAPIGADVTLEVALDGDAKSRRDRLRERSGQLRRSCLEPTDRLDNGFEITRDKHINRARTVQLRVASVNPDFNALRTVDMLELTKDVMDVHESVTSAGRGPRRSGRPMVNLSFSNPGDLANFGRGQPELSDFLDKRWE